MKNCLLIDSSFACIPIVEALKRNYQVFTVGNKMTAYYAAECPKNHFKMNYSEFDEIKSIINKNGVLASIPGCTDVSLEVFGKLDLEFGAAILDVSTKAAFQAFCLKVGLNVPKTYSLDQVNAFPVIVKPDDSFSGQVITVVNDKSQMKKAVENAIIHSDSNRYIIQEYLDGQLYSVSAFKTANGSMQSFLVEEHCNQHEYSVDESFLVDNKQIWSSQVDQLLTKAYAGLPNKIKFLHFQFILSNNRIYPIELMLRCPGDLYGLLVQHSTGMDYGALYAESFGLLDAVESRDSILKKVKRLTLKVSPSAVVPDIFLPHNALEFHRTLPVGHINTSALPVRYAVLFLECENLSHNPNDLNIKLNINRQNTI